MPTRSETGSSPRSSGSDSRRNRRESESWFAAKSQAPNPKLQRASNLQRREGLGSWEFVLGFGRWESVGIWRLELGISAGALTLAGRHGAEELAVVLGLAHL